MRAWGRLTWARLALGGLFCGLFSGCAPTADPASGMAWATVATLRFDSTTGRSDSVALAEATGRVALRLEGAADTCFQVAEAIAADHTVVAEPFTGAYCADCAWRTSTIRQAGLLVLEGRAAGLRSLSLQRVDCQTTAPIRGPGTVVVRRLEAPAPVSPTVSLRLIGSTAVDPDAVARHVAENLAGLRVAVVERLAIDDGELRLEGQSDQAALVDLLADLPPADEGVIDVVIGPCLTRRDPFSTTRLAGLTPRIPGGAGPADAVFVSRPTCGTRDTRAADPARLARVVAHEIGHYLGLFHPQEADGTVDDLPDTDTTNLMHRMPLVSDAHGLSPAQRARLLAHPFVR